MKAMERVLEKSNRIIEAMQYEYRRQVTGTINWDWRMNAIIGARGTGKTTLMLQQLRQLKKAGYEVLYVRLDDLYFTDHSIYDLADEFRKLGGEYLFIDEAHKYPGWAREFKNIYDSMPGLRITFSGSSIIELAGQDADLSRRALKYEMTGLSFREYLLMSGIISLPALTLDDILLNHADIAAGISGRIPVLKHFSGYLKSGYYPYFLEKGRDYQLTLEQVIRTVIEMDLRSVESFDISSSNKMLLLLKVIAASAPFKPNISAISQKAGLHRHTVLQYLQYLEMARMIRLVNLPDKFVSRLQKPDKVFLDNPNLFYALNEPLVNQGSLRETFAANQLSVNHRVDLHERADFLVDNKYVVEIGGRTKTAKQLNELEFSYVFKDNIEIGYQNSIPLWLLGFLY